VADARTTKGLIAGAAVLILYYLFILPRLETMYPGEQEPSPKQPDAVSTGPAELRPAVPTTPVASTNPTTRPAETTRPATVPTVKPVAAQEVNDAILCETELFRVALTNRGAGIKSIILRDFYTYPQDETTDGNGDLRLINEIEPGQLSCTLREAGGEGDLDTVVWEHVPKWPVPKGFLHAIRFRTRLAERGLEISKTYLFKQPTRDEGSERAVGGRDIQVVLQVTNLGAKETLFRYRLRSVAGMAPEPGVSRLFPDDLDRERDEIEKRESRDIEAVIGGLSESEVELETYGTGKVKDGPFRYTSAKAPPVYAGVKNRYFAAVISPLSAERGIVAVEVSKIAKHNITAEIEVSTGQIGAGATVTRRYMLLVVPRIPEVLADYPKELHVEELLAYSWPAPITRWLSMLLKSFNSFTGNYGLAIILLTLCVRVVLHPLTLKSQKSAFKMQKVQPLLKAAKEKFKNDKKQFQQEQMRIMREQGVNPLGGCLPMLLQLPILMGLWRALYQNAGLRHSPFMLWMNDLSKADNLFTFSDGAPLVGGMSFNLLPLLVAVAMIANQKMLTPPSADPQQQQQQKIMKMMPLIFCVMLYSMPSGLMLYFLCSTGFGVAEQYWIRRKLNLATEAVTEDAAVPTEQRRERKQKSAPQRRRKRRK
jgi:YidC/Oxa1 family membrane protein insertase